LEGSCSEIIIKKMNQKIKTSIIVFIIVATLITLGYTFREKLKQELLPIGTIPSQVEKTSEQLAEEQRKVDERVEKLKEGYFEALHAKVLEIDQASGKMKVESIQKEEFVTMEVLFGDATEIAKIVTKETIIDSREEFEDLEERKSEIETTKTNISLEEIPIGSTVQVETGDFFMINQGGRIVAKKITLFEEIIVE
jgi:tRNA/tmRNA/rRNA uracil-C5-methylase (TrmA/RlmC/RlmD family)